MKKYIALITCVFFISGCAAWPFKYKVISTGIDIASTIKTGKSTSEHAASLVTEIDCQWSRLFTDWKVCLTHEEYVDNLTIMNCDTYSWNFFNIPYCRKTDD